MRDAAGAEYKLDFFFVFVVNIFLFSGNVIKEYFSIYKFIKFSAEKWNERRKSKMNKFSFLQSMRCVNK